MMMRVLCISALTFGSVEISQSAEAKAYSGNLIIPDAIDAFGSKYSYNQKELLKNISTFLDLAKGNLKALKNDAKDDKAAAALISNERILAVCVLAAAEFGTKDFELYKALDDIVSTLGDDTVVPEGITNFANLFLSVASVSFTNTAGDAADFGEQANLVYQSPSEKFGNLVRGSKERIEAREAHPKNPK